MMNDIPNALSVPDPKMRFLHMMLGKPNAQDPLWPMNFTWDPEDYRPFNWVEKRNPNQ